jgi:restriction system protein
MDIQAKNQLPSIEQLVLVIPELVSKSGYSEFTNSDLEKWVIEEFALPQSVVQLPREKSRTELQYRLAWARSKVKIKGLIKNIDRKKWILTPHE